MSELTGSYIERDARPYLDAWDPLLQRAIDRPVPEGLPAIASTLKSPFDFCVMAAPALRARDYQCELGEMQGLPNQLRVHMQPQTYEMLAAQRKDPLWDLVLKLTSLGCELAFSIQQHRYTTDLVEPFTGLREADPFARRVFLTAQLLGEIYKHQGLIPLPTPLYKYRSTLNSQPRMEWYNGWRDDGFHPFTVDELYGLGAKLVDLSIDRQRWMDRSL